MSSTAADYIAQVLGQPGVKRIYGVAGDSLKGDRGGEVQSICGAFAADELLER